MAEEIRKKEKWYQKIRNKYKLVILNDETYEEKLSFKLSRLNVFIAVGTLSIILIVVTTIIIAFTPLREYIPGYTDVGLYEELYRLENLTDSMEEASRQNNLYFTNLQRILSGRDTSIVAPLQPDTLGSYQNITSYPSGADSAFREEFENMLYSGDVKMTARDRSTIRPDVSAFTFFTPLRGIITSKFDPKNKHYGVDIVSVQNEAIKSALDGVIVLTGWTLETGYTICVQHEYDLISVYKHNSALLKEQGSFVKAGDPIAIIGSTGEFSSGPHLHFELWYNGVPINPVDIIKF